MNNNSLYNFIYNHAKNNPISFHMPGHKGRDLFKKYGIADIKHLLPCGDITETTQIGRASCRERV